MHETRRHCPYDCLEDETLGYCNKIDSVCVCALVALHKRLFETRDICPHLEVGHGRGLVESHSC